MASRPGTDGDALQRVSTLVEVGSLDTVYRDVYLERARAVLGEVLSLDGFRRLQQEQVELAQLPLTIGRAVEKADWPRVKELSGRSQALRQALEGKGSLIEAARDVYAVTDVKLDPFSPGLQPFISLPTKESVGAPDACRREAGRARTDGCGVAGFLQRAPGSVSGPRRGRLGAAGGCGSRQHGRGRPTVGRGGLEARRHEASGEARRHPDGGRGGPDGQACVATDRALDSGAGAAIRGPLRLLLRRLHHPRTAARTGAPPPGIAEWSSPRSASTRGIR